MRNFSKLLPRLKLSALCAALGLTLAPRTPACELCAIYSASTASGDAGKGFSLTLSEQYVSAHNLQADGEHVSTATSLRDAFVDTSTTHIVPGYNFNSRFGVSVNVPVVTREFRRRENLPFADEKGSV